MNDSQEENKEKLTRFACQLRKLSFPSSPISIPLADFVATALENYLGGDAKSLDAAFGLTPKRGAKRLGGNFRLSRAKRIMRMRIDGAEWSEVYDKLSGQDGMPSDDREIRRIADEFRIEILAEEIKIDDLFCENDDDLLDDKGTEIKDGA